MIKKVIHIADIHIPNSEEARPFSKMLERFLVELNEEVKNKIKFFFLDGSINYDNLTRIDKIKLKKSLKKNQKFLF